MNKYSPFSKNQARYIKKSLTSWLSIAEGGKRASKNIINIISFAMNIENHKDKYHLAAGVTISASMMNIIDSNGFGLLNYFGNRAKIKEINNKKALSIDNGSKIIIIEGARDKSAASRIKGMSFGSVYITEANEVHKSFFFEALDRTLSSTNRKIFLDLNPKHNSHWFYTEFLNIQDKIGNINYGHFTIFDNLSIQNSNLSQVLSTYDKESAWYNMDILGKRGLGSSSIYPNFSSNNLISYEEIKKLDFIQFSIGVDIGGYDATAAALLGITKDRALVIIDGYYHKQGHEIGKTHDKYTEDILKWIQKNMDIIDNKNISIFVESAEKLFRQSLLEKLRQNKIYAPIYPSYKKDGILARIRLFSLLINQDRLFINQGLNIWQEAFYSAIWDEKGKEKGEFIRLDNGSYPLDCLDAAEYGAYPFKSRLI